MTSKPFICLGVALAATVACLPNLSVPPDVSSLPTPSPTMPAATATPSPSPTPKPSHVPQTPPPSHIPRTPPPSQVPTKMVSGDPGLHWTLEPVSTKSSQKACMQRAPLVNVYWTSKLNKGSVLTIAMPASNGMSNSIVLGWLIHITDVAATDNGVVFSADGEEGNVHVFDPSGVVAHLGKGNPYEVEQAWGKPTGLATDREGHLFIADDSNRIFRATLPALRTYVGDPAYDNELWARATKVELLCQLPAGRADYSMATDSKGRVILADEFRNLVQRIDEDGQVTTLAPDTVFSRPISVAVDGDDNIYVVEKDARQLRKIGADGQVTVLAAEEPIGELSRFQPQAVAAETNGVVYVSQGAQILRIAKDGTVTPLTREDLGLGDGPLDTAYLSRPVSMAIDRNRRLFFGDVTEGVYITAAVRVLALP